MLFCDCDQQGRPSEYCFKSCPNATGALSEAISSYEGLMRMKELRKGKSAREQQLCDELAVDYRKTLKFRLEDYMLRREFSQHLRQQRAAAGRA